MNIVDDYLETFSSDKKYDYDALLEKYHGEYFLLNSKSVGYYMIKNDNRYKEIYNDEYFGLYQKNTSE